MCSTVRTEDDRRHFDCQRALALLVGGLERLHFRGKREDGFDLDACLCPVDLEATLTAAGIAFREDHDWDEYIIPNLEEP